VASDCRPPAVAGTGEWTERELCSLPTVLVSTEGIETISAGKLPLMLRPQKGDGVGQREREKSNYAARSVSGRQRPNHRKRGKETKKGERNAVLACLHDDNYSFLCPQDVTDKVLSVCLKNAGFLLEYVAYHELLCENQSSQNPHFCLALLFVRGLIGRKQHQNVNNNNKEEEKSDNDRVTVNERSSVSV